jgi:microcin C transport system substrate-binding protein
MSRRRRGLSRRRVLEIGAGAAVAAFLPGSLGAQEKESHGISAFGDLKYPPDFKHFAYVNPDAPKGGAFSHIGPTRQFNQSFLTFNSLNAYVLRGDAAQGMEHTFAALMGPSSLSMPGHDEPDAMYGYAARAVRMSADGRTYRFLLRPEARFHDGSR